MFGFIRKGDLQQFRDEILGYLDSSEEKQSLMEKYEERIMAMALKESDPDKLEDIRSANQIRRGILADMARSKKMKRLGRMGKLSGEEEEEEEESGEESQRVPTLDVAGQSEAIASAINKIPLKYRVIADTILKSTTGHGLDDIKKNPALAIEMADKFKGLIPQIQAKKKEGTTYKSSSGQEVDITNSEGYALA